MHTTNNPFGLQPARCAASVFALLLAAWWQNTALASSLEGIEVQTTPALELSGLSTIENIIPALADKRVVLVGEQHTRYDHHLVQLEIIRRLHQQDPQLAIGLEMFQQPFQQHLDAYVAGDISEQEMLRDSEYYQRWRADYRLYAPILRYARDNRIPLIALNLPVELTRRIGQVGLDELTTEERAGLPVDIEQADPAYEQRMREVFAQHPNGNGQDFEHFLEVQLLWDEGMADRAAAYLRSNPQHRMVILAGNGHLAYGSAIPDRLTRRIATNSVVILNSWNGSIEPGLADYLLFPAEQTLPDSGKIGALLEETSEGITISACTEGSACETAGIRKGDRIAFINAEPVHTLADLRLAMWDKQPSDSIKLDVVRKNWLAPAKTISYQLVLN